MHETKTGATKLIVKTVLQQDLNFWSNKHNPDYREEHILCGFIPIPYNRNKPKIRYKKKLTLSNCKKYMAFKKCSPKMQWNLEKQSKKEMLFNEF